MHPPSPPFLSHTHPSSHTHTRTRIVLFSPDIWRTCRCMSCHMWCSVVQCSAVWCSVVQWCAVWCSVVQCGTVRCVVVQCGALWCSAVQCGAEWWHCNTLQHTATRCNTPQQTATHGNMLQQRLVSRVYLSATRCNTLQHAATCCNNNVSYVAIRLSFCVHACMHARVYVWIGETESRAGSRSSNTLQHTAYMIFHTCDIYITSHMHIYMSHT